MRDEGGEVWDVGRGRRGGESELDSDLDLDLDLDLDPWKILRIRIRQNDVEISDQYPQHCLALKLAAALTVTF